MTVAEQHPARDSLGGAGRARLPDQTVAQTKFPRQTGWTGRKVGRNSRAVNRKGNRVAGQTNKLSYLSGTAACRLTGLQGLVKDHIDINSELWDCDSLLLKNLRQIPIKEKQYNITRRFPFPRNVEQQLQDEIPEGPPTDL